MLTLHTLASGSEGNSLLISGKQFHILVDAGISYKRIAASLATLGLTMDDIDAILITHEHSDHVCGLATLVKHHAIPIYASFATARQLVYRIAGIEPLLRGLACNDVFYVSDARITVFPTSHDAADSIDFRIDGDGGSIGILTDTGYVTDEAGSVLPGVDLLVLESNHDEEWLLSGPYPYPLKQRILGDCGHLSNDAAARFAYLMACAGTKQIVLAHLSRENNTPERALQTIRSAVDALGVTVTAAPRNTISSCYKSEVTACRE